MEQKSSIDYSLRFINVSESTLFSIKSSINIEPSSIRKYYKNKNNYGVVYPICETIDVDEIIKVISNAEAETVDIFVSLLPQSQSDIIEIPSYVIQLLAAPRLKLTLSYTIVPGN